MAFRQEVERSFNKSVKQVLLFGSRARGTAKRISDYDVAVVLEDPDADPWAIADTLSDLAFPHIVAGVHISAVSIPSFAIENAKALTTAFNIRRDGVLIP